MTVTLENNTVTHVANGYTIEWPFSFNIPDANSLKVGVLNVATNVLTELDQSVYSVTGLGSETGGEVTYPKTGASLAAGNNLVIWRELPLVQETELTNQSPYYATVLETQLDKLVMMIQQISENTDRALKAERGAGESLEEYLEGIVTDAQAARDLAQLYAQALGVAGGLPLPFKTPQVYGAVGDGVTDDTLAFQLACAQPGIVVIPPGTYLIKGTVNVYATLMGSGSEPGGTVIEAETRGNMNVFQFQTGGQLHNVSMFVSNHWFAAVPDGTYSGALAQGNARYGHGVSAERVGEVHISNVKVWGRGNLFDPAPKTSVRVATTANGTFTTAFDAGSTIDGVVLATGDRILIKNQTDQTQNGIYIVQASGSPVRDTSAATGAQLMALGVIEVTEGTTNSTYLNARRFFIIRNELTPVVGTDTITYVGAYNNIHGHHVYGYSEDSLYEKITCGGQMNFAIVAHWGGDFDSDKKSGLSKKSWHPARLRWVDCVVDGAVYKCNSFRLSAASFCSFENCRSYGALEAFEGFYGDVGGQFAQNVHPDDVMRGNRFIDCTAWNPVSFAFTYVANSNDGQVGQVIDYGSNRKASVVWERCHVIIDNQEAKGWVSGLAYSLGTMVWDGADFYVVKLAHTSAAATEPGVGASWSTYWDLLSLPMFAASYIDEATCKDCVVTWMGAGSGDYAASFTVVNKVTVDNLMVDNDNGVAFAACRNVNMVNCDIRGKYDGVDTTAKYGLNVTVDGEVITTYSSLAIGGTTLYIEPSTFSSYTHPGGLIKTQFGELEITNTVTTEDIYSFPWVTDFVFGDGSRVTHGGSNYQCLEYHTSSATTEPGVGVNWTDYWVAKTPRIGIGIAPSSFALTAPATVDLCQVVSNLSVVNCRFADFYYNVRLTSSYPRTSALWGGSQAIGTVFENCSFEGVGNRDIDLVHADGVVVKNCRFSAHKGTPATTDTRSVSIAANADDVMLSDLVWEASNTSKYAVFVNDGMNTEALLRNLNVKGISQTTASSHAIRTPAIATAGVYPLIDGLQTDPARVSLVITPTTAYMMRREGGRRRGTSTLSPTGGTWNQGDVLENRVQAASTSMGWACVTSGTLGTLAGITGSITSGTTTLTLNSATDVFKGSYITIAGVAGVKKVIKIQGLVVTIDSAAGATVAAAAVQFSAPVFKTLPALGA